ncbi:hypothetical protein LCGC14_2155400, partial [marine sediment metagenome]
NKLELGLTADVVGEEEKKLQEKVLRDIAEADEQLIKERLAKEKLIDIRVNRYNRRGELENEKAEAEAKEAEEAKEKLEKAEAKKKAKALVKAKKKKDKNKKPDVRWKIQRFSPIRKKWIDFNEYYSDEKTAQDRAAVLRVRHMADKLKFRVVGLQ